MQNSTITLTLHPLSESDFPKATPRMEELVNEFTAQNPSIAHQVKEETVSENHVFSKNTRRFEDLNDSEKALVLERISGIDYKKATSILELSSNKSKDVAGLTDEILNIQTRNPIYSLSEPVFGVLTAVRNQNPKDIFGNVGISDVQTNWGIFNSIREMLSMKKIHKSMAEAIYKLNTLMKNIKGMQVDLVKQQIVLQKDISMYQKIADKATNLMHEFELDSIALEKIQEKIQSEIEKLTGNGNKELNASETLQVDDLNSIIRLIITKIQGIQITRITTFQSITQLDMLIATNKKLCVKIDEINDVVIPLWKWQYHAVSELIKQRNAISLQKAIRGIASKVLTGNDQELRNTMTSAQKEVSATVNAIDDLSTVHTYIDGTLTTVAHAICPAFGSKTVSK